MPQIHNQARSQLHYQLSFERYREHLVDVHMCWQADKDSPTLWLPSWISGSYLMREFARHITLVTYDSGDMPMDTSLQPNNDISHQQYGNRANKLSKNEWQLTNITAGQWVYVHYEVYCYDLSVRTAYVDQYRLFGNFSALALAVTGLEQQACYVRLQVPMTFITDLKSNVGTNTALGSANEPLLACGLSASILQSEDYRCFELIADSYDELIDYPFEFAMQTNTQFRVYVPENDNHVNHQIYISGRHHCDMTRLCQDLQRICQKYVNWLGSTPFSEYHFLTYASANDYGGLEHSNSTALITPRADLPSLSESAEPSINYQRFLGLCSHEYFHAWWVKTVRPDVMMAVDLKQEAYTPLLWVFEGFTSYIDDFMLQASGVISADSYLKLLMEQINRYQQTDGRAWQSVAESSFDAWIKLYRSDENTANAGISYYNKGALVALCLDILLLTHSEGKKRLFDVVKHFYCLAKSEQIGRIGMSLDNLNAVMNEYLPSSVWQAFVDDYVNGVKPLPLKDMLASVGVNMMALPKLKNNGLPWGIQTQKTAEGLLVQKVKRGSVASQAGLSANDVIIAIDGIKASSEQLASVVKRQSYLAQNGQAEIDKTGQTIRCHVFRHDELICLHVPAQTTAGMSANHAKGLVQLAFLNDNPQAKQASQNWLQPKFG